MLLCHLPVGQPQKILHSLSQPHSIYHGGREGDRKCTNLPGWFQRFDEIEC